MLSKPRMHDDSCGGGRVERSSGSKLADFHNGVARRYCFDRQPRALLPKQQNTVAWQTGFFDGNRSGNVVDPDDGEVLCSSPRNEFLNRGVVDDVLIPVGDHRSPLVPASTANDVHRSSGKRVCGSHNRPNVEIVLPVFDSNVKRVPPQIKISDDRLDRPVPILVGDVSGVAVFEQFGVVHVPRRPFPNPRPNAVGAELVARAGGCWVGHSVNLG